MNSVLAEPTPSAGAATARQVTAGITEAARVAAHLSHEARLLKSLATDAVEDGVHAAKRTYKIAVRRFEDASDQAATCIRKQPFKAVGVALGAGLVLGAAGVWIVKSFANGRARA